MKTVTKVKAFILIAALSIACYAGHGSYEENRLDYLIDVANFVVKVATIFDNVASNKEEEG